MLNGQKVHTYNTPLVSKSTFVFPKVRTNYGKFNIRFLGPKVWNETEESLKTLSFRSFKRELKAHFLSLYNSEKNELFNRILSDHALYFTLCYVRVINSFIITCC